MNVLMNSMNVTIGKKPGLLIGIVSSVLFLHCMVFSTVSLSEAVIPPGEQCSNCHIMHYSQGGEQLAGWGDEGPYEGLVINGCIGCHSNSVNAENTVLLGNTASPVVYNSALPSSPLAGGNFFWVRPGGGNDRMGHNVIEVQNEDDTLYDPPGAVHANQVNTRQLTCAGSNGCHGKRDTSVSGGMRGIKYAHHNNEDGQLNNPLEIWNSYRFLDGVQGHEITGWQNVSAANHNEYYGATFPMTITGCDSTKCHPGGAFNIIRPENQTISGFCATCHGNFHSQEGVGGSTSPFSRHPTDVVLPSNAEYPINAPYNVNAPVARQAITGVIGQTIDPGDVVMCLSCHMSHASQYEKMMRWDYKGWPGNSGFNGCGVCHTSKD